MAEAEVSSIIGGRAVGKPAIKEPEFVMKWKCLGKCMKTMWGIIFNLAIVRVSRFVCVCRRWVNRRFAASPFYHWSGIAQQHRHDAAFCIFNEVWFMIWSWFGMVPGGTRCPFSRPEVNLQVIVTRGVICFVGERDRAKRLLNFDGNDLARTEIAKPFKNTRLAVVCVESSASLSL